MLYHGHEIYRQQIIINDVFIPLNLTIIIPRSAYLSYRNKRNQPVSPFVNNLAYSPFISYLLFFLCLILIDN